MSKKRDSRRSGEAAQGSNRRLPRAQERVLLDFIEGRPELKRYSSSGWPDRGMGRSPITARVVARPTRLRPPTTTPLKAAVSRVYSVVRSTPRPRPVRDLGVLSRYFGHVPRSTRMCVARAERREVLFAAGVAGKGQRNSKGPYKRTPNSKVKCR